ncbi:MAG: hypothetical protein O2923_02575 [Verrucomicrobia bacterium]|nr:hypothetical protein [Verrucomicrobiota bacterium]MDA1086134.1 hypothetical protein [Verrucomicrobiota bacterium]
MKDAGHDIPAMSVVLVTMGSYSRSSRTLESLRRQTVHDQLELIVVASRDVPTEIPDEVRGSFHGVRVEYSENILMRGQSTAQGVRCAIAPIVTSAPLIPVVRFARTCRQLTREARSRYLGTLTWAVLFCGYTLDAVGQLAGYAAGGGRSQTCVSHHALLRFDRKAGAK